MHVRVKLAGAVAAAGALTIAVTRCRRGRRQQDQGAPDRLRGGAGDLDVCERRVPATLRASQDEIAYRLSYSALTGNVTQAHIHFGQAAVNGGISAFLCSNLGNGPAGTQACPPGARDGGGH